MFYKHAFNSSSDSFENIQMFTMLLTYEYHLGIIRLIFVIFFFLQFELSHFRGIFTMKVDGHWVPCLRNSSYSFMPILFKLYMSYGHGLKIYILLDFLSFFSQFELKV